MAQLRQFGRAKRCLQLSVEPLHHPVALRVIAGGSLPVTTQQGGQFSPQTGLELGTAVSHDVTRDPEPRHPAADERVRYRRCARVRQRDCLRPARVAVHAGQKVSEPSRRRQRADDIDMDGVEPVVGSREDAHWSLCVTVHFAPLAWDARFRPPPDVPPHSRPDVPVGDELMGSTNTRVGESVELTEYVPAKRLRVGRLLSTRRSEESVRC